MKIAAGGAPDALNALNYSTVAGSVNGRHSIDPCGTSV